MNKSNWMATLWVAVLSLTLVGCGITSGITSDDGPVNRVTFKLNAPNATFNDGIVKQEPKSEPVAAAAPEYTNDEKLAFIAFGDAIHIALSHDNEMAESHPNVKEQVSKKFSQVCPFPEGVGEIREPSKQAYPPHQKKILTTDENGEVAKQFIEQTPTQAKVCLQNVYTYFVSKADRRFSDPKKPEGIALSGLKNRMKTINNLISKSKLEQ